MKRATKHAWILVLIAVLNLLVAPSARAWNRIGHMIVAGIAFDQLNDAEQKKLAEILSHLANNDHMLEGLGTSADDPRSIVMAASTWPDLTKSDTTRYYHNGYDEPGPLQSIKASDLAKNDKLAMHKGWHFIDMPYHLDAKEDGPALGDDKVNIVQVLGVLDKQLRQPMDAEERAYEIAWLLHLVGDLHQPLHCAEGFDEQNPKGDTGGNDIQTDDPITHEAELHAFWDDILGKNTASKHHILRLDLDVSKASEVISTLHFVTPSAHALDVDFQKWANATHKLAVNDVYKELDFDAIPGEHGKDIDEVKIDDAYHSMATRVARKQVNLAGRRLAVLLKAYLND